jgi:hypothetical protein
MIKKMTIAVGRARSMMPGSGSQSRTQGTINGHSERGNKLFACG